MTGQSHQIHLTTVSTNSLSLSLSTNPSKIKLQPSLSLPIIPSLSHSTNVHCHRCPLAATPSMSSTQLSHYLSNITLTLLEKWKKKNLKKKNRGNIFRYQNLWLNVHVQYSDLITKCTTLEITDKNNKDHVFFFAKPQGI